MESPPKGLALVTGASSGIGEAMARSLARRGHGLVLVARRRERLEALAEALREAHGVEVRVVACDLAGHDAAERLLEALDGCEFEIVVNNAGYGMQGRFVEMAMDDVARMVRLNVLTLTHLTQRMAQAMGRRGRGLILNVSSSAAFLPSPYVSAYAATKAYVMSFSEALGHELEGTGVSLTTLYPGITRTEFNAVAGAKTPGLLDFSILSAEAVAETGLDAMFARRRAVIPGWVNKLNALFSVLLPRAWVVRMAGFLLGRANGWG